MAVARPISPEALAYARAHARSESPEHQALRGETSAMPMMDALVSDPLQSDFCTVLLKAVEARRVLELGTFTGYGTLTFAQAVGAAGRVVTIDNAERWVSIGRPHWEAAGVSDRIDVRIGDASEVCRALAADPEYGPGAFDFVFIDADKAGYPRYVELAHELTRPGGLVLIDNTLFFERVLDEQFSDPDTEGVRAVNDALVGDDRFDLCFLPVGDGMTLLCRRPDLSDNEGH